MINLRPCYSESLPDTIERILDKGIVVDAKLRINILQNDLIKIRATLILSSFSTAAKCGIDFPSEVIFETQAWRKLLTSEECPQCNKKLEREELEQGCPWCGFKLEVNR